MALVRQARTFALASLLFSHSALGAPPRNEFPPAQILGPESEAERGGVAAEVARRGFYSGSPAVGAGPCADCHADIAAQWSSSAHHFASLNNPYYTVAFEAFRKDRGLNASLFCARCHDPSLVAQGAIERPFDDAVRASREAQAGLVCLVCHGIDDLGDLHGNGLYHLATGPVPPSRTPAHREQLRRPILGTSRFCATCHKVGLTMEVTRHHWLRGQDDWDPFQASSIAGQGAASISRPPAGRTLRCQDCHMPLEPAPLGDAAARVHPQAEGEANEYPAGTKLIRSHRFLGANTALPALRGDEDQLQRTIAFLRGKVSLDIGFVDARTADVVLRARGIGHRFPGGTMDSNEVWIEVEALGEAGRSLGKSGALDNAGVLDKSAHLIRAQAVDGQGRPIARRDVQHARGVAWDNSLGPSDPSAVRFALPEGTRRVRARLLYRKFTAEYARLACASVRDAEARGRCERPPIVEVASAEEEQRPMNDLPASCGGAGATDKDAFRRALEHGVALADSLAESAPMAERWLECARKLEPTRAEPWIGLARVALALGRIEETVAAANEALARVKDHPAALLLQARALYQGYRFERARPPIERLAEILPQDRAALTFLSRIRGVLGDSAGALAAAERLVAIDPDMDEAHYQRAVSLRELGRDAEADEAERAYLDHRVAHETDLDLRQRFRRLHPEREREDEPLHVHFLGVPEVR